MLGIQTVEQLADLVSIEIGDLKLTAEFADRYVSEWIAWDPVKKPRSVIAVSGPLRKFQDRFYERVLCRRLHPSPFSFGGVAGRSVVGNARPHIGHRYIYKTDISNFYPTISTGRVNRLFLRRLRCSYEVSRILTRLCTYNYHLALGLVTSPILADQMIYDEDSRVARLCESYRLTFTRFVDDITVSGDYDIETTPVPSKLREIFSSHGFQLKIDKSKGGLARNGMEITGLVIKGERVDIAASYLKELERQLDDHLSLASGGEFRGPYLTSSQLSGRVNYVCWVNPNRRFNLRRRFQAIRWSKVWMEAKRRGLLHAKKELRRPNESGPSYELCYQRGQVVGSDVVDLGSSSQKEPCPF